MREWDGEFVVRNEESGSTHLLGPLAGRVLQVHLESDAPLDVAGIATKLARSAEPRVSIEAVLAEFQRLGLAEPKSQ